jgi:uncharacterized protein YbjT (DUF2867 family)
MTALRANSHSILFTTICMKTALIIGATGLTGSNLLHLLLVDLRFEKIIIFVRTSTGITHPKLEEHIVRFDQPGEWVDLVKGDVLFSAMGTTLKKAGSKAAQYAVDFTYQYAFARAAFVNEVPVYVLVSSAGADAKSLFFYMKMKGELEEAVRKLSFERTRILQPGPIDGPRAEKRSLEKAVFRVIRFLNQLGLCAQYRPIEGADLARAMRNAALLPDPGVLEYRLSAVFELAEGNRE